MELEEEEDFQTFDKEGTENELILILKVLGKTLARVLPIYIKIKPVF